MEQSVNFLCLHGRARKSDSFKFKSEEWWARMKFRLKRLKKNDLETFPN